MHNSYYASVSSKWIHFLKHLARVDASIEFCENAYGGPHLTEPKTTVHPTPPLWKWEKKHIEKLEKEMLLQSVVLLTRQLNIHSVRFFKYSYGTIDMRHIPLLRSSKFIEISSTSSDDCITNMSFGNEHLSPSSTDIPLASNYGEVFCLLLMVYLFDVSLP